jgi:hypothetical protein
VNRSDLIFAGFKKGAFSIYFGDAPIYHFDLEGRWQRAFIGSTHYLKGLDANVHAIDRNREGTSLVLRRHLLGEDEAADLDCRVQNVALSLLGDFERGHLRREDPPDGKAAPLQNELLKGFLARVAGWDADAWKSHRENYRATYGPLPFLPPDCQNSVILQATRGNTGGVSFGHGPLSEHRVRSPYEFEEHAEAVARLMGRRLLQTRVAFLVGSDVLRRAPGDLIGYLDIVRSRFITTSAVDLPGEQADPEGARIEMIHAMLDDFSAGRPDRQTLRNARERGLMHISLGVESGDPEVRRQFGKVWTDDDLRSETADLRACGIKISLLTLVGAGGPSFAEAHVSSTARLLSSLELARGDTVFLLDENEVRDPRIDLDPDELLTGQAWTQQQERLKQALVPLRERGVKVLSYSLEKQWT